MLTNLRRLIHRSTQIQAGCQAALHEIARNDEILRHKEEELDAQLGSLKSMETLNELLNQVVSRAKIFSALRKIAVIRQRRTQLEYEKSEAGKQRKILAVEREKQLALRKVWWLKEQKYERLREKVIRERVRQELFFEEMELDDKNYDKNQ
ncbi:type III secretion protein [Escherichia fergusonii]|uniref:type III secretion protein n=1 Tax=Escherichia fergusonii TaxID=564 RepID=UPI0015F72438|nr:type III secretion protein [Escherichia fergusonii]MBA8502682.1 type III secretion protein [Escherichia fergusonii]